MKTQTIARLTAAVLLALTLALAALPAPAAQAAGADWQRLAGSCAMRASTGTGTQYLSDGNTQLAVSGTATAWTVYSSGSYYALELAGTGKFITSTSRAGIAPALQAKSTTNPDSQLWIIQRSGSVYTFKNVATQYYIFIIGGTPAQYLSSKTTFYISGVQGSTCSI